MSASVKASIVVPLPVLRDMLLLVDRKAKLSDLRRWSPAKREEAAKWAGLVHLRASDNVVRVPDEPAHVRLLPKIGGSF